MSFQDRNLTCVDCNQPFIFTAGEQEFHAAKGFTNDPKRCPSCRQNRRANHSGSSYSSSGSSAGGGGGGYRERRELYPAVCAECGKNTEVPFQPRGDRPVYCSDCYSRLGLSRTRH